MEKGQAGPQHTCPCQRPVSALRSQQLRMHHMQPQLTEAHFQMQPATFYSPPLSNSPPALAGYGGLTTPPQPPPPEPVHPRKKSSEAKRLKRARMQNPAKEIEEVVRGLVEKPTLQRQAAVMQKYFTEDVQFNHFYINTTGGVKDLTAIYQMAELIANYQSVDFQNIVYDRKQNALVLRMTVFVRPFRVMPLTGLKFLTLLELEDHKDERGKTVKKIKAQRDYFERSPLLLMIPLFGRLYDSDAIRTLIGSLQATTFDVLRQGLGVLLGHTHHYKSVW